MTVSREESPVLVGNVREDSPILVPSTSSDSPVLVSYGSSREGTPVGATRWERLDNIGHELQELQERLSVIG